ncbi:MAG: hypothetical protein H5T24_11325 [Bacteroidales bacterium]|nr:hypothetical protein [Bacteroidales bacterium]
MKTKHLLPVLASLSLLCYSGMAQDETEQRIHVTGYINAVAEYSDCINLKKDWAVGLSEVGFLANYKPVDKLEFKTTLVYTHFTFHVSQIFVEAYAQYNFSDALKLGAGRFLTPLSPVNLYFYAPLNPSGVVPMLVSHHFLFPQSISGLHLHGNLGSGGSLKFGYNFTLGTYPYINHFESGVLSIQAQEDSYPSFGFYDTENDKINKYMCGTARVYATLNNAFTLGANYFKADAQQVTQNNQGDFIYYPSTKYTYGFDAHLQVSNLKLNAEYWAGKQETTPKTDAILGEHIVNEYKAYYGELIWDGDVYKPFLRYDFIEDVNVNKVGLPTTAATLGIAIRPRFETLLKLEYKRVFGRQITDIANRLWKDYDYNYAQMSLVVSF